MFVAQGGLYEHIRQTGVTGVAHGFGTGMRRLVLRAELRDVSTGRHEVHRSHIVTLILVDDEEVAYRRTRLAVAGGSRSRNSQLTGGDGGIGRGKERRSVTV